MALLNRCSKCRKRAKTERPRCCRLSAALSAVREGVHVKDRLVALVGRGDFEGTEYGRSRGKPAAVPRASPTSRALIRRKLRARAALPSGCNGNAGIWSLSRGL